MTTEIYQLSIGGLEVMVVRKKIKNLHLGVYPPDGRVRVAVPLTVSDEAVRLAVIGKLGWIKKHRAKFQAQPRQSDREMVEGESHYYLGRRYRLRVSERRSPAGVKLSPGTMELQVRPGSTQAQRQDTLQRWYRQELKALVPPLLAKWQPRMGVEAAEWRVKRMKTKWGSCNVRAKRIWLNLELVKKPPHCLEYVMVHELAHLLERKHNARFKAVMDRHLPL